MDSTSLTRPKLIVVTPVRNEAWVLEAFLTHCSSWADHIIIADHHSTDDSREIALRFPKVKLIDNPCQEWVEYKCRARLLEEASRIDGDKIIFALDADEFLSEGFEQTNGWKQIIDSKPNEIFFFSWLNIYGDYYHADVIDTHSEWVAHYSEDVGIVEEYLKLEKQAVHCSRIPCLEATRCKYTHIDDIYFVHLANINKRKVRNKLDFYQVVNLDKNPNKANPINLYRSYYQQLHHVAPKLDSPIRLCTLNRMQTLNELVHYSDNGQHYIDEMVQIFRREGFDKFKSLCIWDNPDLQAVGINHTPPFLYRLLHWYLKTTREYDKRLLVRLVDKLLKQIV